MAIAPSGSKSGGHRSRLGRPVQDRVRRLRLRPGGGFFRRRESRLEGGDDPVDGSGEQLGADGGRAGGKIERGADRGLTRDHQHRDYEVEQETSHRFVPDRSVDLLCGPNVPESARGRPARLLSATDWMRYSSNRAGKSGPGGSISEEMSAPCHETTRHRWRARPIESAAAGYLAFNARAARVKSFSFTQSSMP